MRRPGRGSRLADRRVRHRHGKGSSVNELPRLTAGEAIAKSLLLHGVDTVFGIPGAHMYHFTDALAREGGRVRFVTTRHEQGAGHLAYGYAKSTGRTGVYTVVPGPGVLNSASALSVAYGRQHPALVRDRQHHVPPDRPRPGSAPRAAGSARDPAQLHRLGRAHRPRDGSAPGGRRGVPPDARGAGQAGGDRGAVGRVRQGRAGRSRYRPDRPAAARAGHRPDPGDRRTDPRGAQSADRRRRRRPARAGGGGGARRADPGAGHRLPQRQGRGRQRQPLRAPLRRGV